MPKTGKARIQMCLECLQYVAIWELECAKSDANWYEMYEAEAIIRAEIDRRYRKS